MLKKDDGIKITKVELVKTLFTVVTKETGRTLRISVEPIVERLKMGQNVDTMMIHTNQKDKDVIEVPVSLDVI
jgi:hypothetical protein